MTRLGLIWAMALVAPAAAIPNTVFGPIVEAESPLNGSDLTDRVLAAVAEDGELPGKWVAEGTVAGAEVSHLLARPRLFGREVVILRAVRRDGALERVEATFADAGSFFGYFDEKLPDGLTPRQQQAALQRRLKDRQREFAEQYAEALEGVREAVAAVADRKQPRTTRFGRTRALRAEPEEWRRDGLVLRLFAADQRLVRLTISPEAHTPGGWMDEERAEFDRGELASLLAGKVVKSEDGSVRIDGLEPVPQGYRPYCGLNTLAMAARHFGMHLDEDWMAAAAGFRNTGSAAGSNMVKLYHAVAAEAGLSMERSSRFDESAVRRALASGMPVIVWRRFSWERNRLHDRVAAGRAELPDPSAAEEKASWPGEDAPLHASVLTGYDPQRGEVFFLESWGGRDRPRRMSFAEMASTAYLTFVFGG